MPDLGFLYAYAIPASLIMGGGGHYLLFIYYRWLFGESYLEYWRNTDG